LGYFYSGLHNRAIKGVQFLSFSLIDVKSRRAYPLSLRQLKQRRKKKEEQGLKWKRGERATKRGAKNQK